MHTYKSVMLVRRLIMRAHFEEQERQQSEKYHMTHDPNDSWAQVELYRWQHGELPPQGNTCKKLDEPTALRAMADAIESGCRSGKREDMPSPHNVCSVMRYVAGKLERKAK